MSSCTCEACRAACRHEPGAFLPTQDITVPIEIRYRDIGGARLVLPTARTRNGVCEHFVGERCAIYDKRPAECEAFTHGDTARRVARRLDRIAVMWASQDNIRKLKALPRR